MSLLWPIDPQKIVTDQPRLHALIVAVAAYPHLNGGTGKLAKDPLGLTQITTSAFTGT